MQIKWNGISSIYYIFCVKCKYDIYLSVDCASNRKKQIFITNGVVLENRCSFNVKPLHSTYVMYKNAVRNSSEKREKKINGGLVAARIAFTLQENL